MLSTTSRKKQEVNNVFEELCLSRKVIKKAECTQTPHAADMSALGEMPDESVTSVIEMLRPSIGQLHRSKSYSFKQNDEIRECEVEEISVDRSKKIMVKDHSTVELKEVFEELCLSRKSTRSFLTNTPPEKEDTKLLPGEVPDEGVTTIIEMLRPSIRQLYSNKAVINTESNIREGSSETKEDDIRPCKSEPIITMDQPSLEFSPLSTNVSQTSIGSTITSTMTESMDDGMIKTLLSPWPLHKQEPEGGYSQEGNRLLETITFTDDLGHLLRGGIEKRIKLKNDNLSDSMSTNTTNELHISGKNLFNDTQFNNNHLEEQNALQGGDRESSASAKESMADNDLTILRNNSEWTDTPFSARPATEESSSNVDSEPTRGCSNTFQYKIQFNRADKNNSNAKKELKRFKAILHTGKRFVEKNDCRNATRPGHSCILKPVDGPLSSQSSLNISRRFSEISLSTASCCASCEEEKESSELCYCQNIPFVSSYSSGKPKEFWAITKINVYPDQSRTYEVMPLTGKKPAELPEKSDSVFVLIPPKQGVHATNNL